MDRQFHVLDYRLDGTISYLIWFSDDRDGVVLDDDGRCPTFRTASELRQFALSLGLTIEPAEAVPYDLDEVERWLKAPAAGEIRCELFLDAWNLFDDLAQSVQEPEFPTMSKAAGAPYDKLFWGCNLPAVTPPGECFVPAWSDREVEGLRRVLGGGMALLRRTLKHPA